jgi:hypothetical protein
LSALKRSGTPKAPRLQQSNAFMRLLEKSEIEAVEEMTVIGTIENP